MSFPRRPRRSAVFFAALLVALLGVLFQRLGGTGAATLGETNIQRLLDDPAIHDEIVAELVSRTAGIWDSHSDPTVGRVLQPRLDRFGIETRITSNAFGMRERDYELPKPSGLLRIVVLGDSLVFGHKCPAEKRMGVHLGRFIAERCRGPRPEIEVLHIGITSWNLEAECAYLRRQLGLLQPDLVLHVTTSNDLDDTQGVRGFGELSRYSPLHRERADVRVEGIYGAQALDLRGTNPLTSGLDHESKSRFQAARSALEDLVRRLEARGARYALIVHWLRFSCAVRQYLTAGLDEAQIAALPMSFWKRKELWVDAADAHWNPEGMRLIAELMYGLIRTRGLLPGLDLPATETSDEMLALVEGEGRSEFAADPEDKWSQDKLDSQVDATRLFREQGSHFYGGIDPEGRLGPYASIVLSNHGARRLVVRGRGLDRPEIDGLRLKVYADEFLLEELVVLAGQPFERAWELPPECLKRMLVVTRFEASDFAYVGPDLQHCVAVQLEYLGLEGS